ncbi:MAG: PQQ-binding-like beta-propeller repeat protein, partial [Planctomycetota bacterium]
VKRGVIRVLWGKNRMLAIPRYDRYLFGCDLETGEALELTELNQQLKDVTIEQIRARRDGSVWLFVSDKRYGPCRIIELSREGKLRPIEHAVGLGQPTLTRGGSFIESTDHATWISLRDSIVKITDENLVTYGQDTGYQLGGCDLVLTADGSLFCCNGSAYCYTQDPQLLALSPAPRRPIQSDVVWNVAPERRRIFDAAFKSRESLVVTRKRNPQLVLDLSTGKQLSNFDLGDNPRDSLPHIPWLFQGAGSRPMLATGKKIYSLDAQSQEITHSQSLSHDYRIAPVETEQGMLIVPKSRGREMQLIDSDGQLLWTAALPGYIRGQLAVNAKQVIVQTRGSRYGGQATTALDITTGKQLWSEVIDAYGNGATNGTKNVPFVESAYWMSPNENRGWVIGRRPDGSRAWTFEVDSLQPVIPIVDTNNLRVFGIFVDGTVVCLEAESGKELWRHQLPEALPDCGMVGSYGASFPIHQFRDGLLLVVDRNLVLNILDGSQGKELARIQLGSTASGLSPSAKRMIAAPWVTDSLIVTAYQDEIVAIGKPSTFPTPSPILAGSIIPQAHACITVGYTPTCKCNSYAYCSPSGPLRRVLGRLRSRCWRSQ